MKILGILTDNQLMSELMFKLISKLVSKRKVLTIVGLSLLFSCAHRPPEPVSSTQEASKETISTIQIESSISVMNKKNQKTQNVTAQMSAERPNRLRVDVTGPLNIPVAQLILKEDQVGVNLFRERKSYSGRSQPESLKKALPIALNPNDLLRFLFDETPSNWKCGQVSDAPERVCVDPARQIRWTSLSPNQGEKAFRLETSQLKIDFDNKILSKNNPLNPQLFEFRKPSHYRSYKLD